MNKNLHRIIFNSKRGQRMVVAETASSQGKAAGGETPGVAASGDLLACLRPLRFAVLSALGAVLWLQPAVQAQVIADPSAPASQRPTILQTANGLPQVNIQSPSAGGVSRNTYIQFDVPQGGVILNNSRGNVQTQLGGFVPGNPWLATGAARVILNEVNSSNPSQIRGYVEVAGQRAEVIIANPAGINVNGGGFLNASRVTLTTGSPVLNSGALDGFRVQGGTITVNGAGLDTSTADYTGILARAVQLNAGIWAKELRVTTGANQIDATQTSATPIAGTGPAPTYAIDVAQVGGMYAGKIFLIGTETGLGVRNAGAINATGGDLVLQSNGWLTNTGSLLASGNLQSATTGLTTNSGTMYANGNAAVAAQAGVSNTGSATLGAQGNTTVQASGAGAQVTSATGAVIAAGLNTDGSTTTSGNLTINAASAVTISGKALAGGNASLSGSQLNLADSTLRAQGMSLTATGGDIDASRANLNATGLLATSTAQTLRTDAATVVAGQLRLAAGSLSNLGGQITQTGTTAGSVSAQGQINNTGGRLASNGNTTLQAQSLANQGGTVQTTGSADLAITTAGVLDNTAGDQLVAGGNLTLNAAGITNAGKLQAGSTLTASATDIDNAATGEITGATTQLTATNSLTNRGLVDGQVTRLDAQLITNTGTGRIYGDTLSIAAATLNNTPETIAGVTKAGVIAARNRLDIGAGTINNGIGALIFSGGTGAAALNIGGSLDASRQATGLAQAVNNAGGTIESLGGLTIAAAQINNTNPDFAYTVQFSPGTNGKEYVTGQGTYSPDDVGWIVSGENYRAASNGGYFYYDTTGLQQIYGGPGRWGSEDGVLPYTDHLNVDGKGRVLLKGAPYSDPKYAPYFLGPSAYVPDHNLLTGARDGLVSTSVAAFFGYDANSPVWQVFGVARPSTAAPGPRPTGSNTGHESSYVPPNPQDLAAWEAAAAPWIALQAQIDAMRRSVVANAVAFDAFRDYNQSVPSATITSSAPGRILSGGAMTLNARDALLNDQAQIVAGGALNITGRAVDNRGRSITVNAQRTGTAYAWSNYNEGCGGWDGCDYNYNAYRDSAYVQDVPKTFVLDVNRSQGMTAPSSQGLASGTQLAAAVVAGGAAALPASSNSLTVPSSSLFRVTPNPVGNFIVETDPRFANYRNWLGSDYMLNALGLDPATTQKRLGDGFYEQRLVNEQVAQLTGQRFLANYTSEEVQYKALMDAGVTFAQQFQLRPGVALTAAQVAQLTSDIVWLVEQDVTVPDGRGGTVQVKALVPVVYVVPRAGDLSGKGVLLAGREVNINLGGDLTNSGTIAGRNVVSLTAENVQNISGRITGDAVTVAARNDINVTGGQIDAVNSLTALAGRDINIVTTTSSATNRTGGLGSGGNATAVNASSNNTFSMTGIDRVAGLYVTGNVSGTAGTLVASAGRDLNVIAGVIGNNNASGSTMLAAGNNINLATVTTANSSDQRRGDDDFVRDAQTKEVGSQIQTAGSLSLNAGNDLNARVANVQATGDLTASAGNNVNLSAGRQTNSFGFGMTTAESDLFSSSSTKERRSTDQDNAVGSSLGGKTVTVVAGKDINVKGSAVISDTGTTLAAGRNIAIEAAQNTSSSTSFFEKKESGLLDGGGIGITIGTREQSNDQKNKGATAAASTVGAVSGNVTLVANDVYKQVGSDVIAPKGDIIIAAKTVDIVEAREASRTETEQKFKQSGLTLEVTSPVISALQTIDKMSEAASQTKDSRMQALAGANMAFAANNAYNAIQAGQMPKGTGGNNPSASQDVEPSAAEKAGGINLAISIGSSKSQSNSLSESSTARGSNITAGNNITIAATGGGQASNLTIQGSTVEAGKAVQLIAENEARLLAAQNLASERSTNSSSSGSVGVSFGTDGFLVNVSASKGKGRTNGDDTSYTNTQIKAGEKVSLTTGGDATLQGAVIRAEQVKADIGGNLNITSLQDSSTYTSSQQSLGGSLSVGVGKISGSISASSSNINSNFQSVAEQSGIKAGSGGFQVSVAGNTALLGSVIASDTQAVNAQKNSFKTGGTLSISDIQNTASYKGESIGISFGGGATAKTAGINGLGIGIGSDKGDASSTSSAGISGIAGNTAVRSTDAETGLKPIFDAARVQAEINAQVQITQAFTREAPKAAASFAESQAKALRIEKNEEEAKKWDEGGIYRIALHTVIGALGGGVDGALGAATSASSANLMNALQDNLQQSLQEAGLGDGAAKSIAQVVAGLTAAGIGAAVGGTRGAATAWTVDANNRQLHYTETQKLAAAKEGKTTEEKRRLDAAACALIRCADGIPDSDPNWIKLNDMQRQGDTYTAEKAILQKTGEFIYQSLDAIRDGLTRNGEAVTRVGGAVNMGAGAVGVVGGGVIATGGAVSCVETLGLGCVAVPIGVGIAGVSNQQMQQGNSALFGSYQSGEGQRVLDSFNLATYPGERDPLMLIGIDAAKLGLAYLGGKYIPKALAKAEGLGAGGANGATSVPTASVNLADRAVQIRTDLNIGGGRNIGVAQYTIDGNAGELVGVSGQASRPGTVNAPTNSIFNTIQTGNNPRTLDSEYKILSELATKLTSSSKGVVNLYSELPVCASCNGVIDQFRQRFPGVTVNVITGKP